MWCKHCRQDVPSIGSPSRPGKSCVRCGAPFSLLEEPSAVDAALLTVTALHGVDLGASASEPVDPAAARIPIDRATNFEDWQLDQNFRRVQARVGPWKSSDGASDSTRPAANRQPQWHIHASHPVLERPRRPKFRARPSSFLGWLLVWLGLMALTCGTMLVVCSFVENRPELWRVGLPIFVAGQVGLLLGLVLQLERLWQNSRHAERKLAEVGGHVQDLEKTTSLMNVTHGSAAQAFYAHMADQANPHLALADLQGQLDLLTRSLAKRKA